MSEKAATATKSQEQKVSTSKALSKQFARFVERYGGVQAVWKQMDPKNVGAVDEKTFTQVLTAISFKGNGRRVFAACDVTRNGEIDIEDLTRFYSLARETTEEDVMDIENAVMGKGEKLCLFEDRKRDAIASNDVLEFVELVKIFGGVDTIYAKFCSQLGGKVSASLTKNEFLLAFNSLGFHGDPKLVFQQMDLDRSGHIGKEEFYDLVNAFNLSLLENQQYSRQLLVDIPKADMQIPTDRVFGCKFERPGVATLKVLSLTPLPDAEPGGHYKFVKSREVGAHSFVRIGPDGSSKTIFSKTQWKEINDQMILVEGTLSGANVHESSVLITAQATPTLEGSRTYTNCSVPDDSEAAKWLLSNFQALGSKPWPAPSIAELFIGHEMGEARLPGAAEERNCLFQEDMRRQREIAANGASSTAKIVTEAAAGAKAAVVDATEPDDPAAQILTPTSGLDARVVLTDRSEVCMWLQTAVVDRTGRGSEDVEDAVFVVELRDTCNNKSVLHAQLDVAMIQSIEQLEAGSDLQDPSANVSFVIKALPGADLGGSVSVTEDPDELWDVCHRSQGLSGAFTLYIVAGPSVWKRREAVRFFDELRILAAFLAADNGPPAAAAINLSTRAGGGIPGGSPTSRAGGGRISGFPGMQQRQSLVYNSNGATGRLSALLGR